MTYPLFILCSGGETPPLQLRWMNDLVPPPILSYLLPMGLGSPPLFEWGEQ